MAISAGIDLMQDVDLKKLKCLSTLGAGGFGQVLLVEYGGYHYALKCMKKQFVVDQGLVEHVKRERVGFSAFGDFKAARPLNGISDVLSSKLHLQARLVATRKLLFIIVFDRCSTTLTGAVRVCWMLCKIHVCIFCRTPFLSARARSWSSCTALPRTMFIST